MSVWDARQSVAWVLWSVLMWCHSLLWLSMLSGLTSASGQVCKTLKTFFHEFSSRAHLSFCYQPSCVQRLHSQNSSRRKWDWGKGADSLHGAAVSHGKWKQKIFFRWFLSPSTLSVERVRLYWFHLCIINHCRSSLVLLSWTLVMGTLSKAAKWAWHVNSFQREQREGAQEIHLMGPSSAVSSWQ